MNCNTQLLSNFERLVLGFLDSALQAGRQAIPNCLLRCGAVQSELSSGKEGVGGSPPFSRLVLGCIDADRNEEWRILNYYISAFFEINKI